MLGFGLSFLRMEIPLAIGSDFGSTAAAVREVRY
jgi:hypothetical protein